jgi:hypothetical protein
MPFIIMPVLKEKKGEDAKKYRTVLKPFSKYHKNFRKIGTNVGWKRILVKVVYRRYVLFLFIIRGRDFI